MNQGFKGSQDDRAKSPAPFHQFIANVHDEYHRDPLELLAKTSHHMYQLSIPVVRGMSIILPFHLPAKKKKGNANGRSRFVLPLFRALYLPTCSLGIVQHDRNKKNKVDGSWGG